MNVTLAAVPMPTSCFIAGTLVHTSKGLVPIQDVRVGDMALSQPEGKGALAYKPVLRTLAFEDKEITLVRVFKTRLANGIEEIGVTDAHPFWVKDVGWVRADLLSYGDMIELHDGSDATVLCASPLYRTADTKSAWATKMWGVASNDGAGNTITFNDGGISVGFDNVFNSDVRDEESSVDQRFRAKVFNIEVDDFHTYYVGERGIWVHNNCGDAGLDLREENSDIQSIPAARICNDRNPVS